MNWKLVRWTRKGYALSLFRPSGHVNGHHRIPAGILVPYSNPRGKKDNCYLCFVWLLPYLSLSPSFLQAEDFNSLSLSFVSSSWRLELFLSQPRRSNQFTCCSFSRSSHDFRIAFFLRKLEVLPYTVVKSNLGSNSWKRRTIHGWFTHSLLSILCSLIHSLLLFLSFPFSLHFLNWTLASRDWFEKCWTIEKHEQNLTIEAKRWEEFSWEHCRSFSLSLLTSNSHTFWFWSPKPIRTLGHLRTKESRTVIGFTSIT